MKKTTKNKIKYDLPKTILETTQEEYTKWLKNKAKTHLRRDKKRGNTISTPESYREEIHRAVEESNGKLEDLESNNSDFDSQGSP